MVVEDVSTDWPRRTPQKVNTLTQLDWSEVSARGAIPRLQTYLRASAELVGELVGVILSDILLRVLCHRLHAVILVA